MLVEADRVALCGPKGVPDTARQTVRGGTELARRQFSRLASSLQVQHPGKALDRIGSHRDVLPFVEAIIGTG